MGVTLDGYVAGPGDWGLPAEDPDVRAWKVASLRQVGTHIMGRVTCEEMAGYWPDATGEYAGRVGWRVSSVRPGGRGWLGGRMDLARNR